MTNNPRILIILEGGLVQHVLTDTDIEVLTIDYDTEGADVTETVSVPQDGGAYAEAYITDPCVDINAERTATLFSLVDADQGAK